MEYCPVDNPFPVFAGLTGFGVIYMLESNR